MSARCCPGLSDSSTWYLVCTTSTSDVRQVVVLVAAVVVACIIYPSVSGSTAATSLHTGSMSAMNVRSVSLSVNSTATTRSHDCAPADAEAVIAELLAALCWKRASQELCRSWLRWLFLLLLVEVLLLLLLLLLLHLDVNDETIHSMPTATAPIARKVPSRDDTIACSFGQKIQNPSNQSQTQHQHQHQHTPCREHCSLQRKMAIEAL